MKCATCGQPHCCHKNKKVTIINQPEGPNCASCTFERTKCGDCGAWIGDRIIAAA